MKTRLNNHCFSALYVVVFACAGNATIAQTPALSPVSEIFALQSSENATLTDVQTELLSYADAHDTAEVRFALGACEFLMSVERGLQDMYRSGFGSPVIDANSFVSRSPLSVFQNLDPIEVSPALVRASIAGRVIELAGAETMLGLVDERPGDAIALTVDVLAIRFDINGDGVAREHESVGWFVDEYGPQGRWDPETNQYVEYDWSSPRYVTFDRGDVDWLRGYCHILMAAGDFVLAHDFADWFERTGHVFFAKVDTKYEFLVGNAVFFPGVVSDRDAPFDIMDLIVLLTQIDWAVSEPRRLESCRQHLISATQHSRAMWNHYLAETDNANEWIPNPDQDAALTTIQVTGEMPEQWDALMSQIEKVLEGELLLPFWRNAPERGFNFKRALLEHDRLNPWYWLQGSAAAPYLEKGNIAEPELWREMARPFEGEMFRFGFWFN